MSKDIIRLLPESIANQIAAGEVIQRPASVIKELVENAVDAGASSIDVVLKDSGKSLILVQDNGKGMSETDARMAFERHATSKIRTADDLFSIDTMGFRGEALASIASIAHVDLKTKMADMKFGTNLVIKGSKITKQENCACANGTQISVKNLFYNVPARRKFLKSDSVELRHIVEEFKRVALIHPEIFFKLIHNEAELYHLPPSNLRQRIVSILGKKYNEWLLPVEEETDMMTIQGFVGKIDAAKKQKGDQYLFVNSRFIKSNYLNHAIKMAYGEMIAREQYAFYILNLSIDPAMVDINVHPTKHEVKFDEERLIYNFVNVAIKHSLGKYSINPMLDFEHAQSMKAFRPGDSRDDYITSSGRGAGGNYTGKIPEKPTKEAINAWQSMYEAMQHSPQEEESVSFVIPSALDDNQENQIFDDQKYAQPFQIQFSYILHQIKSGYILIDQQNAHRRILYEQYLQQMSTTSSSSQQLLFPVTMHLAPEEKQLVLSTMDQLAKIGFLLEDFGDNSIIIQGVPMGVEDQSAESIIKEFLQTYMEGKTFKLGTNEKLALSLASSTCIKRKKQLSMAEMKKIIDELFACERPFVDPIGKKTMIQYDIAEIDKLFQ